MESTLPRKRSSVDGSSSSHRFLLPTHSPTPLLPRQTGSQELTVFRVHDLEVLDRGPSDSTMEIEHVGAALVAPRWRFVLQQDKPLVGPMLEETQ